MRLPPSCQPIPALSIALSLSGIASPSTRAEGAFVSSSRSFARGAPSSRVAMSAAADGGDGSDEPVSGSFFNQVPPPSKESATGASDDDILSSSLPADEIGDMDMFEEIIRKTSVSRAGGGGGFARTTSTTDHVSASVIKTTGSGKKDTFVGIGKPLNDIQNPEYDENGYTLYADETTGEKKRVFEALVEYPSVFKMKIVGQDDEEGSFAPEIVKVVADSCGVEISMVKHTKRVNGKWTSVTVHAPVKDADMLYSLYENVDKDPRVKFKF